MSSEPRSLRGLIDAYTSGEVSFDEMREAMSKVRLSRLLKDDSSNLYDGESWYADPDNAQVVLDSAVDVGAITDDECRDLIRAIEVGARVSEESAARLAGSEEGHS